MTTALAPPRAPAGDVLTAPALPLLGERRATATAPALPSLPRLRHADLQVATLVCATLVLAGGLVAMTAAGGLAAQRTLVEAGAFVLRAVMYGGALVAVGGAAFVAGVHDGHVEEAARLRRMVRAAAAAGVVATLVSLPVQAAVATGGGLAGLSDGPALAALVASPFGVAALLRSAGLVGLAGVAGRRGAASLVAAAGALLVVGTFALTGHAATSEPRWLVAGSTVVHTATAGLWVGGLLGLAVVLRARRGTRDAVGGARAVGRFSTLAGLAIAALIPTGTVLGIVEVGSVSGLVGSGYGRALLAKVTLVAGVVAVGAYNRWRLVPAITRNTPASWSRLARTVRWELVGLLGVVVATGLLTRLAPPA